MADSRCSAHIKSGYRFVTHRKKAGKKKQAHGCKKNVRVTDYAPESEYVYVYIWKEKKLSGKFLKKLSRCAFLTKKPLNMK